MGIKASAHSFETIERIRKSLAEQPQGVVRVGILNDPYVAFYAACVEFGTKRMVARPFLRATFSDEKANWQRIGINALMNGWSIKQALEVMGLKASADVQETIVNGASRSTKFARRKPSTMASYARWAAGHYTDGTPANLLTDQPLVLTGLMKSKVTYELL